MSVYIMVPVFETTQLTSTEKLVALSMADNARQDGSDAFPSISTTARKTGLSDRTIQRTLQSLVKKGVLKVQKEATPDRPTTYQFLLSDDRKSLSIDVNRGVMVSPPEELGVTLTTGGGDIDDRGGCHSVTLTVNETSNNISTASSDAEDKKRNKNEYTPDFEAIWKIYPNNKGKFSAFKKYQARLKEGLTPEILTEAVKNYALEVTGREQQYIMHADTFFGSSRHWEDYVSVAPSPEAKKENLYVAMAYDAFDKGEEWYDCEREELTLDNPSARGYTRPTNSRGQLVDAQGVPYELTVQGERKAIEE